MRPGIFMLTYAHQPKCPHPERRRDRFPVTEASGSDAHTLHERGSFATHFNIPIRSPMDRIFTFHDGFCRPEILPNHPLIAESDNALSF